MEGCCNDARLMVNLLLSKGFEEENIKLLVDDDDEYDSPNHVNVKNALNWLCRDREPGDVIFMHFSGHGTQVPSDDDDHEVDNLDEAICLEELFLMADDDLKQYFSQLPEGVRATVVMDCCHSGSMLDGTKVAIEGAKDEDSAAPQEESDSLLSALGGSREAEHVNRSLPISVIADVMSGKLGHDVQPTGSGIQGAMAQAFGGNAGKLMMKFALHQLAKSDGGGEKNQLVSMLGGFLGGGSSTKSSSGVSGLLSSFMGGGGGTTSSSNPMGNLMGMFGGSDSEPSQNNYSSSQPENPLGKLTGMLGDLGLSETTQEAPAYNPAHEAMSKDVCTLISGCQADETSADVRPPGGDAYGALTKTLTGIYERNPDITYYDLVSQVRTELSKGGYKQNPCLECSEELAQLPFIC